MKNSGFSETVDKILRSYGLLTSGCIGTIWGNGDKNRKSLVNLGYYVERGIDNPDYDYVIISKENSTLENVLKALTLIKVGCIIIFRADSKDIDTEYAWDMFRNLNIFVHLRIYNDDKLLGVIFKRKEV